jgi:myo-inositol catabolism protein IolC
VTAADGVYMLAFDHRSSFSRDLLGITGTLTEGDVRRVEDLKHVIYEGFSAVLADGVDRGSAGLLVDEQFGAGIARDARARGVQLAMPVEMSGRAEFDFEFGDRFGDHIERFDPTYAKVLVRYNAAGDAGLNRRQAARLRRLSDWLRAHDRRLLFELLVPAAREQLARVGHDGARYDHEIRPGLVLAAMRELQDAGVEPDIWKIEGLEARADCERVARQARAGGRTGRCIVLGRGADERKVAHWLRQAAGVEGFIGFAVGRTLWWAELAAYVAGSLPREQASARIAGNYARLVGAWAAAA